MLADVTMTRWLSVLRAHGFDTRLEEARENLPAGLRPDVDVWMQAQQLRWDDPTTQEMLRRMWLSPAVAERLWQEAADAGS